MLEHPLFTNMFGWYRSKEGNYSRHSMLDFILFMAIKSEDYYLSTKDKYQILYLI